MFQASKLRVGFVVGLALLAGLLPVLIGPLTAQAVPLGLSVTLSDGKNEVRPNTDVTYEAVVRNDGTEPATITLVVTVPSYVSITDAPDATIEGSDAAWNVTIDPGQSVTKTAGAHIADIPSGRLRVTTLASVYEGADGQVLLIRNADANHVEGVADPAGTQQQPGEASVDTSGSNTWINWFLSILLSVVALAGFVGAVLLLRRRGRKQLADEAATSEDTSTPQNATDAPAESESTVR